MVTVATHRRDRKNEFVAAAEPFLQGEGLPFSDVLSAEWIQGVFREEDGLFAQDDIFSTDITLGAFLAQTPGDGKGAACSAAVADITTYMLPTGRRPPAGDTGDHCRARAKLSLPALRDLVVESAEQLDSIAAHEVPLRPGRIEPCVLKRRRDRYPLMHGPRDELRGAPGKT